MTSGSHKIDVFMISGFVAYRRHGNIDFSKIAIIRHFRLNQVVKISCRFDEEKSTKKLFKNLSCGPQKTKLKHLS